MQNESATTDHAAVPRVTVVVPCYNSLRWLPETLDSIRAQTFADFEVVLVDDGGSDDLAGWASGLGDPRLRVVRQANAGVSAARNRGVAEARGELVAFCDSDDLWEAVTLERLLDRFDEDPTVGLVYGWYDVIQGEGEPTGRVEAYDWEGEIWERLVTANAIPLSAAMLPRSVFESLGGFRVNRDRFPIDVEDWELWLRLADGHRVSVVKEVLMHHRRHDDNSTSSSVDSLDSAYRHLLQTAFEDQPAERLALRPLATARAEMLLGWHSLVDDEDAARALAYRRSAVRHLPELRRGTEYWRLGAAATALRLTGPRGHHAVRSAARRVRRLLR
jgi:glycosyltransferase involved in cell wall biosynthesis